MDHSLPDSAVHEFWISSNLKMYSLVVQWLVPCRRYGSIPGPGTKIPHGTQCGQFYFLTKNKVKTYVFQKTWIAKSWTRLSSRTELNQIGNMDKSDSHTLSLEFGK